MILPWPNCWVERRKRWGCVVEYLYELDSCNVLYSISPSLFDYGDIDYIIFSYIIFGICQLTFPFVVSIFLPRLRCKYIYIVYYLHSTNISLALLRYLDINIKSSYQDWDLCSDLAVLSLQQVMGPEIAMNNLNMNFNSDMTTLAVPSLRDNRSNWSDYECISLIFGYVTLQPLWRYRQI